MSTPGYNSERIDFPLAYLITIRAYGTWLHGDQRLAVDRHGFNRYGTQRRSENSNLETSMSRNMLHPCVIFNGEQCKIIEQAIKEVCSHRSYELLAINVRTNHAHAVVSAHCKPETIADAFKSYSTRRLRESTPRGTKSTSLGARQKPTISMEASARGKSH